MVFTRCRCLLSNCTWAAVSWLLDASWAPLEASWAALGRLLEPTWSVLGASWSLLGASWSLLVASWSQPGRQTGVRAPLELHFPLQASLQAPLGLHLALQTGLQAPLGLHLALQTGLPKRCRPFKNQQKCCTVVKFRGSGLLRFKCSSSGLRVHLECLLGASWAPLGRTWLLLGASWSQLGASWAPLGASWAPLGLNLAALAASWAQLGSFGPPNWPSGALLTCKSIDFPQENRGFYKVSLFAVELHLGRCFVALGRLLGAS